MGQGQDKIASSLLDLQPTAIIELFLMYFNTVDNPDAFIAFHGGSVYDKGIVWQGVEYLPIPVETDGFEVNANGQLARPKIRISNQDYFATDLLINNEDLQFAKIIRKRTFVKYLDDENFDGGNPWGEANASAELASDTFVVGQKTAENKTFVELELTSPLDLENFEVNNRLIMSRYCSWHYRGKGCNYSGIPVATEEGEALDLSDPADWFKNKDQKKWRLERNYKKGDAVFLENTKVKIQDGGFAKIWYICQSDHTSSEKNRPDRNQSRWKRDGCNKKLDGCRLRFGSGLVDFNEKTVQRTANYLDLRTRMNFSSSNNMATIATISTSSTGVGYSTWSLKDSITGANSVWQGTGTNAKEGRVTLEWPSARRINRIDVYGNPNANINWGNARIRLYNNSNTAIRDGVLAIPNNGSRATTGFSATDVTKIIIDRNTNGQGVASLSEVAAFESNPPHLVYNDIESLPLHRNNFFQISTWVQINNQDRPDFLYSVFHNISGGCRYSGINLYASGNNLLLDFATRTTGAGAQDIKRTLKIPWKPNVLSPLHLICNGGLATGLNPSATTAGWMILSDGANEKQQFTLPVGQYFRFKNSSYQSGIDNSNQRLKFGLNNWQFPSHEQFAPDPPVAANRLKANVALISPMRLGPTAFWTGGADLRDVRITEASQSVFKDYGDFTGRSANTTALLGWWEMAVNNSTSGIGAINNNSKRLNIVADSPSSFNKSEVGSVKISEIINAKKPVTLPFGGFPGTEKYG